MTDKPNISDLIRRSVAAIAAMSPACIESIDRVAAMLIEAFSSGKKVLICGNGGSAADAQHIAGELAGHFQRERRPLPAMALSTDTSVLTAIANDYSFEEVFARQVQAAGEANDVLWAISTSGNSPNVLAAARAARGIGMKVVAFTGVGGGKLAGLADVALKAPADVTWLIQQCHQVAYHAVCEIIDAAFGGDQ